MTARAASGSVVFLSAVRTPFGTFGGKLKDFSPVDLAVHASKAAIERAGVTAADVDQTIFGNVLYTTKDSIYFARHVALKSGCRQETSALTLNRLCGSGFQAVVEGWSGENADVGIGLAKFVVLEEHFGIEKVAEQSVAIDFVAEFFLEGGLFVVEFGGVHAGAGPAFDRGGAAQDDFLQLFRPATRGNA